MKNRDFPTNTIQKYSWLPQNLQKFLRQFKRTQSLISVIIVVHNMQRVAPRTLQSFTAAYQGISSDIYEVIVVENGSDRPLSKQQVEAFGPNFRYFFLRDASPSPVGALNFGVKQSKGRMVALMIDGAHLVTPGVLKYALRALKAYTNPVVSISALHLGPQLQSLSIKDGYSEEVEDGLLQQIDWPKAGYKLFTISSLSKGTNDGGWFLPMNESNCVFVLRRTYDEIGGFDERFDLPGGGLANLDFYHRVCEHPTTELIQLLSEASFYQIHGTVATNHADDQVFQANLRRWMEQYKAIRGEDFKPSTKRPEYWGDVVPEVIPFLDHSIQRLTETTVPVKAIATQVSKEEQDEYFALIQSSGLFDERWYLANNPDVAQAKMDPVFHYLQFGGIEGRDPGPNFSSNWYLHTHKDVKKAGVNPLVHYLKYGKAEGCKSQPDPIIVHQMGKVGSKTVELSLIEAYQALGINTPIYHTHALNDFEIRRRTAMQEQERGQRNPESTLAALEYGEHIRKQIDENPAQHWNLVSLVRDPIARNIAIFFHILSEYIPNWGERYTNGKLSLGDVQALFLSMASAYNDLDNWFSRQMKAVPAFGIDVYENSFPREIGYRIYPGPLQASLLLIRLENLNGCAERAMHEFLGLENFALHNTNVGTEKDYADLYRAFRGQPLPVEYVQRIYNTQFARHFYTDAELLVLAKRWTGVEKLELAGDS